MHLLTSNFLSSTGEYHLYFLWFITVICCESAHWLFQSTDFYNSMMELNMEFVQNNVMPQQKHSIQLSLLHSLSLTPLIIFFVQSLHPSSYSFLHASIVVNHSYFKVSFIKKIRPLNAEMTVALPMHTVQCSIVLVSTALYSTVQYSTVQGSTVPYNTIQ